MDDKELTFGQTLRKLRADNRISLMELKELIINKTKRSYSCPVLSALERSEAFPSPRLMLDLSTTLNHSYKDFFTKVHKEQTAVYKNKLAKKFHSVLASYKAKHGRVFVT